ncbi:MAG: transposase [Xanthomonadales bacterium]|nr:transposase [Xanthomonadales bacterium]
MAIDLAKSVFQVAGEDERGTVVFEDRIKSRESFVEFLRTLKPPLVVLMETGPGAQSWARELQSHGIEVFVLPAQRVEEHRSGAKNDRKDTFAILRAGRDKSIHAVPVKSVERLTMQACIGCVRGTCRGVRRSAIRFAGCLPSMGWSSRAARWRWSFACGRCWRMRACPFPFGCAI